METTASLSPGLHFTTTLRCPTCRTVIRYVDQAPPWRESEARKRLVEEADLYLAEHDGSVGYSGIRQVNLADNSEALVQEESDRAWARFAPFWVVRSVGFFSEAVAVRRDIDFRCVDCPACSAEVFVEDAVAPE